MRSISPTEVRRKTILLEREMLKLPQVALPLFHHFLPGLYLRELHIPAGVITTGKIHKYECLNFLTKGERSTVIDGEIVRVKAPHFHISPAGSKRVSYTHQDSVWITAHFTDETDVAKLEAELVCDTEKQYIDFVRRIECHS